MKRALLYREHSYNQLDVPETIMAKAVMYARLAFENNRAAHTTRNLKTGRVDPRRLAAVPTGERRVFEKRQQPDAKDYEVFMTMDCSGSTSDGAITHIKRAGLALGNLCDRVGIPFSLYGHTSYPAERGYGMTCVEMFVVKERDDPWTDKQRSALRALTYGWGNLDGHTLEQMVRKAQTSTARHRVIFYVTDGEMPAENHDEELVVLQHNIKVCKQEGITLIGVGVGTDSPTQHGLETFQIDGPEDLPKFVTYLRHKLSVA
jgi:nitric oxide reductase activation protein